MNKLSIKILLPSIFILFVGLVGVIIIAHTTTKNILSQQMIHNTQFSLDSLISQSMDSKGQMEMLKKTMSDNFVNIVNTLALKLEDSAESITPDEYKYFTKKIGVDEIHVTDEKGILQWGSEPEFFGFDFNSSKQSSPFIKLLNDSNSVITQDVMPRAVDGVPYQYFGVSRLDKPGIIQIGIRAVVMQDILNRVDLQKLIDNFHVDDYNGLAFIIDLEGVTLKHKKRNLIGTNIKGYDWGKKLLETNSGSFYYELDGQKKFLSFRRVGVEILVTTVFVNPYITPLKKMDSAMLLTSIIMALLLSALITFLLTKIASSPLGFLNKKILELAEGEGDLTQEILIKSKDEVGDLARGVNDFVSSLRVIVGNVKKASSETQKIKDNLNKKSGESTFAVNKITNSVSEITDNIGNLDNYINESISMEQALEANINELNGHIENQSSAVEQSTASINEMVASLKNVSGITLNKHQSTAQLVETTKIGGEKVSQMNKLVLAINGSVGDISKMVEIINDIASRTSLLSMNAAIEAAHAGDQGKGFAVVADEIRKLSESTEKNAKSINTVLANIRTQVMETSAVSKETNSAFAEINSEVTSVSEALSEINLATEELSNGGQQILEAMFILQDVSSQVRDGAEEMNVGAKGMNKAMGVVKKISGEVLTKVNDITTDSISIDEGARAISILTEDLSRNAYGLDMEINRFKTNR